jgi:preprotein translocase subunit SecA
LFFFVIMTTYMSILNRIQSLFTNVNPALLKEASVIAQEALQYEVAFQALTPAELISKTVSFKARIESGETLDSLAPEVFAAVREASRRTLGQRHYDVQLVGGYILHKGAIAEMRTGEGKTLVATLPAYLRALTGKGIHIVTVNDYLSRRDAGWMGHVFEALGVTTGVLNHEKSFMFSLDVSKAIKDADFQVDTHALIECSRKEAYACDITYGTNQEFGFDYLRDNLETNVLRLRQREYYFALVDEIDSILIDEARTPLIISGALKGSDDLYTQFSKVVGQLHFSTDYVTDEKNQKVTLTDVGIHKVESILSITPLYTNENLNLVHHLEIALKAKALYTKNKQYVVKNGEIVIVDEFTGRMQPGRRWSEGLHQAIEAKEGVVLQEESRTLASITYQNYFRNYQTLAGMTGTAKTSSEEFYKVYGLDVVSVPTHRNIKRLDLDDLIFQTEKGKYEALTEHVKNLQQKGQPVLIGTTSVEKNELLSAYFTKESIRHEVLNAKNHEREGEIIALAGLKGAVTIATNMAGRGVDIKLGGPHATESEYDSVVELGGLFVIGTERHEARRIDNQLRGRSGRQGDPGITQFYLSLEDSLMRIFASDVIKRMMGSFGIPENEPIQNSIITRSLEKAQSRIEDMHFDARKQVLAYDDIINAQRKGTYTRRSTILHAPTLLLEAKFLEDAIVTPSEMDSAVQAAGSKEVLLNTYRSIQLQVIDTFWMNQLDRLDHLRDSVNLRAIGQRDPLVEYKKEAIRMFRDMEQGISSQITFAMKQLLGKGLK